MIPSTRFAVVLLFLAACGCAPRKQTQPQAAVDGYEIATRPAIVADYSVPIDQMTLRGVALGSPRGAIGVNRILSEDKNGWVVCRDACRYRILDEKVITLGAWDQKILGQLGVNDEADIVRVFGKPEGVEKVDTLSTKMTIYRFADNQRRASWDRIQNRLAAVNVGAAIATAREHDDATRPRIER